MDLVVHTAGPFQGLDTPLVLDAALQKGVPYVDVCDEKVPIVFFGSNLGTLACIISVHCMCKFDSLPNVMPCRVVSLCVQVLCEAAKERMDAAEKAGVAAIVSAGL
jgi:saccharopine dehydrogenase-like NADP-dependent oxidoreductase